MLWLPYSSGYKRPSHKSQRRPAIGTHRSKRGYIGSKLYIGEYRAVIASMVSEHGDQSGWDKGTDS